MVQLIVLSLELSSAIFANCANNKNDNLILVKESLIDFQFPVKMFDYVFCYGVAHHLPEPLLVYESCV